MTTKKVNKIKNTLKRRDNINKMIIISNILKKIMIVMMKIILLIKNKNFIKVNNIKQILNIKINIIQMKTQLNNLNIDLYQKVRIKKTNILWKILTKKMMILTTSQTLIKTRK